MRSLNIYTDGASRPRTSKRGGFGFAIEFVESGRVLLAGGSVDSYTTNAVTELYGAISAMKFACLFVERKNITSIKIHCDAEYVVKNSSRYKQWKAQGWKNTSGAVKNKHLWIEFDVVYTKLSKICNVEFIWVKGHNGNRLNELADKASTLCADVTEMLANDIVPIHQNDEIVNMKFLGYYTISEDVGIKHRREYNGY